jgi:hypothetical protein
MEATPPVSAGGAADFDGCQEAFRREPGDSTAKLRELAVIRLAKAKRELLDGGER